MLKGLKILLADDNELCLEMNQEIFEEQGAVVSTATNGKIALDLFSSSETGYYDIVVMDIRMPELDGINAMKAIRALKRNDASSVCIIANTAEFNDRQRKSYVEMGFNDAIVKPVTPEKIAAIIL